MAARPGLYNGGDESDRDQGCSRAYLRGAVRERPAPRLPHHGHVAEAGRQGNPAQKPESDLLPDQRRRPRGGAGGSRHDAEAGARLVPSLLPRPRAMLGARHDPARDALEWGWRQGRSQFRRPPDAIALGPQGPEHRLAVVADRHAVPARDWYGGSGPAVREGHYD